MAEKERINPWKRRAIIHYEAVKMAKKYKERHPESSDQEALDVAYNFIIKSGTGSLRKADILLTYVGLCNDTIKHGIKNIVHNEIEPKLEHTALSRGNYSKYTGAVSKGSNRYSLVVGDKSLDYGKYEKEGRIEEFPPISLWEEELAGRASENFARILQGLDSTTMLEITREINSMRVGVSGTTAYNCARYVSYDNFGGLLNDVAINVAIYGVQNASSSSSGKRVCAVSE